MPAGKDDKKGLQEGRQEGLQEGRQEGLQEGRQEGLQEGRQEGLQEGRQEGLQEGRQQVILNMLRKKLDISLISEITGLSEKEITKWVLSKVFLNALSGPDLFLLFLLNKKTDDLFQEVLGI